MSQSEGGLARSKSKLLLLSLITIVIVILVLASVVNYDLNPQKPSCDSVLPTASRFFESGLTPVCGIGESADGRLRITIHNYYFARAGDIQFHFAPNEQPPLPDEVFMVVNVTVENIGGGNTSIGAGWEAAVLNDTSYVSGVTNFIANSTFNTYPNQTIPDHVGVCACFYLPPGARADFWVFFYIPFGLHVVSSNILEASSFRLQFMMYRELGYGGTYEGDGAFGCLKIACQNPNIEFVIQTQG